jgi:NtrC-family two-component system response regulator AlgB
MRVLVIDDEANIRTTLRVCLEAAGCQVALAAGVREALAQPGPFALAFLDLRLGEADGQALLPRLIEAHPRLAVVIITAYATIESAVATLKAGAFDYLPKPFTPAQVRHVVDRARERHALQARVGDLEDHLRRVVPEVVAETREPAMARVIDLIERAAPSDSAVLLTGESGTGKGVLAHRLHAQSRRAGHRFVTVNCPTLTPELLASELFGHARGAFTGAVRDQPGKVEEADGGTLFLDEVGEITPELQSKLLRFAQEKRFERLGETRTRHADVRLVAATHRDLEADVAAGRFRLDLLYRLNVIEVEVPPLRTRRADLLDLARHFLHFFATAQGRTLSLSPAAEALLLAHPWPGNVRELRNEMERAAVLVRGRVVEASDLSSRLRGSAPHPLTLGDALPLAEVERLHIQAVVGRCSTREEAAQILGIDPSTLWRKLKRYEELSAGES